jgi:DNA repair protein RadA/Sms
VGAGEGGPQELSDISVEDAPRVRLPSEELNTVLGGGLVPGSVVLLAGDPGIGKSTLFLQIADVLSKAMGQVLYVSGEESPHQVRMRAQRIGASGKGVFLLSETSLGEVFSQLERMHPAVAVVDSIQTMSADAIEAAPGSVAQVRECARQLLQWAKATRTPVLMTGHVTKDGEVAGPRVLEHMVDVVLYLEGESTGPFRLLRAMKNRFGSTNEVAVFQMESTGLVEVHDPSRVLLASRRQGQVGDAVAAVLEGSRPLMVEIQALTAPSQLPVPRRLSSGVEQGRMVMLSAVLSQRARMPLGGSDVIVNVTGGLRVTEPAADLAIALAIASSFRGVPLPPDVVAVGEVGLSGELRPVPQLERRLREAARLGFARAVAPAMRNGEMPRAGIEVAQAETVGQAIGKVLGRRTGSREHGEELFGEG